MRVAALVFLAALLLGGCPATVDPTKANDHLRERCPGVTDAQIEVALALERAAMESGATFAQEMAAALQNCESDWCVECSSAVVRQVYGED